MSEPEVVETEEPEVVEEAPEAPPEPSVEEVARKMGWRPKEEWEGAPEHHKSPSEWILGSKEIMDKRAKKIDELDRGFRELRQSIGANTRAAVAAARKQEREKVLAERAKAFEEQDAHAFNSADEKLRELDKADINVPAMEADPDLTSAERNFLSRNDWYQSDKKMTAYANKRAREIRQDFRDISPDEFFELIEDDVKREFRSHFVKDKPARQAVESGTPPASTPSATGWEKLDPEIRSIADEEIRNGTFKDRKEYMKFYKEAYGDV